MSENVEEVVMYRGKLLAEMSRDELERAVIELGGAFSSAMKYAGHVNEVWSCIHAARPRFERVA